MARHLCIVARDNSPLYGFLTIAFRERPADADTLDVVLDRRRGDPVSVSDQPTNHADRRRHVRADDALRTRGYAIVAGPGGMLRASDEAFIERAVGILADVERRGPLALRFHQQRRAVGRALVWTAIGAVFVLALVWVLVTLPRIGGLARVTDDLNRWTDTVVGGLEDAWTTLSGGTVAAPPLREPEGNRTSLPGPSTSEAASPPLPSPSLPTRAEMERAAPAMPPAPPRAAAAPESRPAAETARPAEPIAAPLAAARPPAPRAPAMEPARPAPREPLSREASPREPAPRESSELADTRSLVAFNGLPRVELSRQPSSSGNGIVYIVRLADTGGRLVPGAQVWMRGQSRDGQARETRLDPVDPPGTYRSNPLPANTLPPQLSVRVFFSNMRVEVPVEP
jgi:hypothetical protein